MKRLGRHPDRALTDLKVRSAKAGRYADGNGLYLVVDSSGARRWILRTVVQGRRRDIGLGSARLVSLAQARSSACEYRGIARQGDDPLAQIRKARRPVPTFEMAAKIVHEEHAPTWKNDKHGAQWLNTLTQYAFPEIGKRRIDQIETPDILRVLAPIWLSKYETARRLKQRIRVVLDWAKAAGHRVGDNPVDGVANGLPKRPDKVSHHAAMPHGEVPGFVQRLRETGSNEGTKLAFELLILTATRTSEILGCRWEEIDFDRKVWTIPASRMKAGREHRVPLTDRCLAILRSAKKIAGDSAFVFPGSSADVPMTNMVFLMALGRMEVPYTTHGFRSSFRDWASERTNFAREVCEMALAHSVRDKTEAAYRRGDLFEKRRALMSAWSSYVSSGAEVVTLRLASARIQSG